MKEQLEANRCLLVDLPWSAWTWQLLEILEVARMDSAQIVEGHMWVNGPQVVKQWVSKLVTKPAGVLTNRSCLALAMSYRCFSEKLPREQHHEHTETSWRESP